MCGIAGLINFDGKPVTQVVLKGMTDAIAHRGPDGEGQWIEGNVGLGHRRLSIIDLSQLGHQPMISCDDRYVLSYNGEIYNYRELRAELETQGYGFRSNTDTEVVLYALSNWGVDALLRFNGMFAFALWDRKERQLLLARDRYGIKPLYISRQGQTVSFGSEQKAILAQPGFKRRLDKQALLEYFTFQNIFTDRTLFQDIHLLPAGYYVLIDENNPARAMQWVQYWDYHFVETQNRINRREYLEELDRLFRQAVNRQLISDVEIGAYLSGGMDSGSITAIASESLPNLKSFTCGFDLSSASGIELGFDERQNAEAMSSLFKTEHYEIVLKSGDMERCLSNVAYFIEEPRVGQSYPNYYVAKLTSKFVKVVLSGTGGDELFGGYPWRYYKIAASQNFEDYIDQYYLYWQRLASNSELKRIFAPIWNEVNNVNTRDIFRNVFATHQNSLDCPEDYINHSLYFEAKTFLQGLFVVEDKLSMAHGLENRVPFMDNDLVDFAMHCPVGLKIKNLSEVLRINENELGSKQSKYYEKTSDGKQILREMMSNYIPSKITGARKQGFSSPDASWFKGESIEFVKRVLMNNKSPMYRLIDYDSVTEIVNRHIDGSENRRLLIWSLLSMHEFISGFEVGQ